MLGQSSKYPSEVLNSSLIEWGVAGLEILLPERTPESSRPAVAIKARKPNSG